jgi:hypothetical protein
MRRVGSTPVVRGVLRSSPQHPNEKETAMSGMIITAHVKDPTRWEQGFRSHKDLLKQAHITVVHYTITKSNDVVMYSETDDNDPDRALKLMDSPETARAMEEDGVDRATVRVYSLDKDLRFS